MANESIETDQLNEDNVNNEANIEELRWYHIDWDMLPVKASYFFQTAKESAYLPFMLLFLTSIGLDPADAGLINGLRSIGLLCGAPIWGFIADSKNLHRYVTLILCVMSILFVCSLPLISLTVSDPKINVCPVNVTEAPRNSTMSNDSSPIFFSAILVWNIISAFFDGCTVTFVDTGAVKKMKHCQPCVDYGKQRVFGSIGYGFGAILSSLAVQLFPKINLSCYTGVFIAYFLLTLGLLVSTQYLYRGLPDDSFTRDPEEETAGMLLLKTIAQGHVILYFLTVLLVGVEQSLATNFSFLFLEELKASNLVFAVFMSIGAVVCGGTLYFSSYITNLIGNTWNTLSICCFAYFVRYVSFSYVNDPWQGVIIQGLESLSLGLYLAIATQHVKMISPPKTYASMYGIMYSLQFGFAYIITNIVGGMTYKRFGGRLLFLGASIIAAIWSIFIVVYVIIYRFNLLKKDFNFDRDKILLLKGFYTSPPLTYVAQNPREVTA